jgi:hypothetical protein
MAQRVLALVSLVFYGTIDRITAIFFDDPSYPDDDDPLASPSARTNGGRSLL